MQEIHVAHSPDSDDAFMFWALVHDKVDTEGLKFVHELSDIQTLNEAAKEGRYELTAISYYAYPFIQDKYQILSCGSSVGNKYGPVLISKKPHTRETLKDAVIAVPGKLTTAYLALNIWDSSVKTEVVPFDKIMDKVADGTYEAGLIIHEGQLTYKSKGFHKVVDLGEWWFEMVSLPLPLGGNAVRRDLGEETIMKIARSLKRSVEYALEHREEALAYARTFSQGLDDKRLNRFIDMYVNDMTVEADLEVQKAIRLLLFMGYGLELVPEKPHLDFLTTEGKIGLPFRGGTFPEVAADRADRSLV